MKTQSTQNTIIYKNEYVRLQKTAVKTEISFWARAKAWMTVFNKNLSVYGAAAAAAIRH